MFVSLRELMLLLGFFVHSIKWLEGAIAAPPWANPKLNPCAIHPMGWRMLYWPPDGACYKIFQKGHPCPEDKELTPSTTSTVAQNLTAECRCPPKTAEYAEDGHCYQLFTVGPCQEGSYFAPESGVQSKKLVSYNLSDKKYGTCKQLLECPEGFIFWPLDNTCYKKYTRGPCSKGLLLTEHKKLPSCRCSKDKDLRDFRYENGKCYQHFTKGPCQEKGSLFLTNQICGCHNFLPHFHEATKQCYELDTIGPCQKGEVFRMKDHDSFAKCHCKEDYTRYLNSSSCYRPYTQGPCPHNHFLVNSTSCIKQPCRRGFLFFPKDQRCYRIGTKGSCPEGRVVTFDFRTRPSVDGISYNGLCVCEKENCDVSEQRTVSCAKGWIRYKGACHKLYSQGPCQSGTWLVPYRATLGKEGICECIPGYTKQTNKNLELECMPPSVIIAEYLNKTFRSIVSQKISINTDEDRK
ncbi:uncharacterized protein LOC123683854 isoform X3 [Harmonia axyridis]|uniref:uncharacterized protein LOC123683854 isoform X3 n=1 Tax=Harmonia axyridis TaxID=115357 RepID=UPI001E2754BE|nr:uncharacterized protein LOC123683854 isoform X3 [Harmonia axyridis]